jgi:hypothetical protein
MTGEPPLPLQPVTARLRELFVAIEATLIAQVQEARRALIHSGNKGTVVEDVVREFLRQYLPPNLAIGQGEVIDYQDRRSKQTDIVIVTGDHPFTYPPLLPGLYVIAGVAAGGEIKTVLTSKHLADSLEAAQQFKALAAPPSPGDVYPYNESDLDRFYARRPWFLFAFESQLSLEAIRDAARAFQTERGLEHHEVADGIFISNVGSVIHLGSGEGELRHLNADGAWASGYQVRSSTAVLFDFLWWLSVVMPKIFRQRTIMPQYVFPPTQPWIP